jgi:hypothetical protein
MPSIAARKGLLAAAAAAVLVLALVLLLGADATRADPPVRSGDTLTLPFTDRATLTVTSRDAAACGGAPCVEVSDPAAPAQPAGPCESLSSEHLALRCSTAGVASVEVAGSGNLDVAMRVDRPAGSACPAYALTLREGAAGGPVSARDGCPQRIVCTQYYVGRVDADGQDVVDASCLRVTVDGALVREPGTEPLCTTPYHGCVPDGGGGGRGVQTTPTTDPTDRNHDGRPDAGTKAAGPEPITSVRMVRAGRRAIRSTVVLSTAARMNVNLMRRTPRGRWVYVRSLERQGRPGRNVVSLRRKDGRRLTAGLYRTVVVTAVPGSKAGTSKTLRVRR